MHLAVFKVNHLGDNLVFLPVVQALRQRRPQWRVTLVTAPHVADLYRAAVDPENLLLVAPDALKHAWRRPWTLIRWMVRLRSRKIDASLISYDQTSVAHGLSRVAGGRVRVGAAGLAIRLRGTATREIAFRPEWSIAKWNWEMGRALVQEVDGGADWPGEPPPPDLSHLTQGVVPRSGRIVIHAGSKWEYTRWPLSRFADLAGRLARDHEVIWVNAPETKTAPLPAKVTAVDCPDLGSLVRLLASASAFVGNNSGPMHIANAVDTPSVIVCGPSSPVWDPQWHRERFLLLRTPGLPCLPCDRGIFAAFHCTNLTEPMACMARWSVEALEETCRDWFARHHRHAQL